MTPARLLETIAARGSLGLAPKEVRSFWADDLRVLLDLGLVARISNGDYCASTEKGDYPIYNRLGRRHSIGGMSSAGMREMGHTMHFGRRRSASL